MFEIRNKEKDTWITCAKCGGHIRTSTGGKCKCSSVEVSKEDERGVQMIVADDSDDVVIENE